MKPERIQLTVENPQPVKPWTVVQPTLRKIFRFEDFDEAADFGKNIKRVARHSPSSNVKASVHDDKDLFVNITASEEETLSDAEHGLSQRIDAAFQILAAPMTDS